MEECVDGEYQNFKAKGGATRASIFFGKYPELRPWSPTCRRGDLAIESWRSRSRKVYSAYAAAVAHKGQPTVILAKTVKGYGLGKAGEGLMSAHQQKKLDDEALKAFRDRFTSRSPMPTSTTCPLPGRRPTVMSSSTCASDASRWAAICRRVVPRPSR